MKYRNHLLIFSILLVGFSVHYLFTNQYSSLTPKAIKDNLQTGAKNSLGYIHSVRAYPFDDIPEKGLSDSFSELEIRKYKRSNIFQWETIGPTNIGGRTLALAIHPENPDILFVGSASGGLWKSTTGGSGLNAWEYIPTGHQVLGVAAIDIDANNPNTMFIGTGEAYGSSENYPGIGPVRTTRGSYGIGILKSTDGGLSWTKSLDWSLNQKKAVQKIQINPLRSESIWAATTDGLYKSTDGGDSWSNIHSVTMATDIIINPLDTNMVFVAHGGMGSDGHGIYRTKDGGKTFTKANLLVGGGPFEYKGKAVLSMSSEKPNIIYASIGNSDGSLNYEDEDIKTWVMKTEDFGETWNLVFSSNDIYARVQGWYAHAIAVHPRNENIVWAAGQPFSVFKSTDGGVDFMEAGMANTAGTTDDRENDVYPYLSDWADHHDIIFHPTMHDTIYFINDGGIFKTTDGGITIENCNSGYQTVQFYNGVSNSNTREKLFLGGLQDNSSIIYEGDLSWRREWGGDGAWTALNQDDNNIAYLSAQFGQAVVSYDLFKGGQLYWAMPRGTDSQGNEIFPRNEANFITPYILSPADNQTMYMGGERIYRYNALSQNWTTTNNGYRLDGNAMSALAGSEQDANVVYAASSPKLQRPHIYRTANGGNTWRQITRDLPDRFPTDLAVDPNNDLIAYVTFGGFETSHVFRTENGGESWEDIGQNLPDIPTWSITVNPNNSSHLFVGNEIGVYQSVDSGKNWQNINGNLPDAVFAIDLIISRSNNKLRLATHGNGAYEIDINQLTNIEEFDNRIRGFELLQNYPNPFNPSTSISYILPMDAFVKLEIFNSLGQKVEELVSDQQLAGKYIINFDASNMSSGTYFYKLTTPSFSETKKMTLIK